MLKLNLLNPQQRSAVETIDGPVLILAGAGTGKTRVITYRIAHMIERGIAPEQILAVTFTNKAAREMKERVHQLVPRPARGQGKSKRPSPTLSTFHSLGVRILRQHIERLGYKSNFVIYDDSEQLAVVKKVLSRISAEGEKTDPRAVLPAVSRFKNRAYQNRGAMDAGEMAMAETVCRRYESALRACNAVDFDDLLLLTLKLFEEHPDVLAACREKYRYIMVDEYQDTNAAQFKLLQLLAGEHRNLCVVGDDDQSIYGWRGAEIANLLELEQVMPDLKVVKLEQNYRSTNTILTAANSLIQNNPRRRTKQLWSQKGQGGKITLHTFANDEEEARTVVEEIEYARMTRRVPWSEQAILFRTNLQSRPLETALRQAGVRYHLVGGQSFFDRREIKDFLAYLKVFSNPNDDVSLLRIANVPARGLSDLTLQRLLSVSQERHVPVFTAMKHSDVQEGFFNRTRQSIQAFIEFLERTRFSLQSGSVVSLVAWAETFLNETGYWEELRRSEKNPDTAENRVRNLKELVATMDRAGSSTDSPLDRLATFLDELALDTSREEDKEQAGDSVTLITVHSCKGLEFPHVYVVGLEDGLFPHSRSKVDGSLDEERRLFYVAMTRAMQSLTLSHCLERKKYGQPVPCHPSAFLEELPADLVEHADEKNKQPVTVESGRNLFDGMRAALD